MSTGNITNSTTYTGQVTNLPHPQGSAVGATTNHNGKVYVNTGSNWYPVASPTFTASGSVMLNSNGKSVSVDEIIDFMDVMKRRMCILLPDFEKHEQYPSLREAYENYLLIERLCTGDDKDAK